MSEDCNWNLRTTKRVIAEYMGESKREIRHINVCLSDKVTVKNVTKVTESLGIPIIVCEHLNGSKSIYILFNSIGYKGIQLEKLNRIINILSDMCAKLPTVCLYSKCAMPDTIPVNLGDIFFACTDAENKGMNDIGLTQFRLNKLFSKGITIHEVTMACQLMLLKTELVSTESLITSTTMEPKRMRKQPILCRTGICIGDKVLVQVTKTSKVCAHERKRTEYELIDKPAKNQKKNMSSTNHKVTTAVI